MKIDETIIPDDEIRRPRQGSLGVFELFWSPLSSHPQRHRESGKSSAGGGVRGGVGGCITGRGARGQIFRLCAQTALLALGTQVTRGSRGAHNQ